MSQVAVDTAGSASWASGSTITVNVTVGANSNRKLLCFLDTWKSGSNPTVSSITWQGGSDFKANALYNAAYTNGTDNFRQSMFWLTAPATGAGNIVITLSASPGWGALTVVSVYNAEQSDTAATAFGTVQAVRAASSATTQWISCDGVANALSFGQACVSYTSGSGTFTDRNGIPIWIATGTMSVASAAATITGSNAPSGRIIGDIEFASVRTESGGAKTFSWNAGWNKIGSDRGQSTNSTMGWAYRLYDGSNVDPVVTWTGNSDASIVRHLLRDQLSSGTPISQHGTNGSGTASPCTATGANTTANDVLAVLSTGSGVNGAFGTPGSSFTERYDAGSSTGPARQELATKEVATSGTGTGNTSCTNTSPVSWVSQQFQLFQALNGDQTIAGTHQVDNTAGETQLVAYETADAYNAFGWVIGTITPTTVGRSAFHVKEATGGDTGTLAKTNANDTIAASGSLIDSGTLASTNVADTLAASGKLIDTGTLAKTNANDTLAASGALIDAGTLAKTNANDTLVASGAVSSSGTLAKTGAADTLAATGKVIDTGTLAKTEGADALSASGTVTSAGITGTMDATEQPDTGADSGLGIITGVLGQVAFDEDAFDEDAFDEETPTDEEARDTLIASGFVPTSGSLDATNANDSFAAAGATVASGTLARTNANDTLAASGSVVSGIEGTMAATGRADTSNAQGKVASSGTLARTSLPDTLAASGRTIASGALARTNANDTLSATGQSGEVGSLAKQERPDTLAASGKVIASGTLAKQEQHDTLAAQGSLPASGTMAVQERRDSLAAQGSIPVLPSGLPLDDAAVTMVVKRLRATARMVVLETICDCSMLPVEAQIEHPTVEASVGKLEQDLVYSVAINIAVLPFEVSGRLRKLESAVGVSASTVTCEVDDPDLRDFLMMLEAA